jgi:heat shock protein HslJ
MKKLSLVLPLAIVFASCSTQKSTTTSNSTATGSTYATSTLNNTGSTSGNVATGAPKSRFYGYDINTYDPNNYMQNPEKYKTPRELGKEGGWTYNNKWNQNTNFLAEALGEWLLTPTEEVAAFWIPDSSRADTYASYWTPEAVAARQQAKMLAAQAYSDSVRLTQSTASIGKGKSSGMRNRTNATSGSGSTGTMAAGGVNATSADASATTTAASATTTTDASSASTTAPQTVSNTKNYLMAVNGNMFAVPKLNLYLQNGTFVGYTGSNELVGNLTVNGTQLKFDQLTPSTNMPAMGGFSQAAFMERLGRVDSYDITDGQLRLKQGSEVLFVLGKNTANTATQQ